PGGGVSGALSSLVQSLVR
nr:RecName: Full=Uncharacterized protein IMPP16 [Nautilus macromphalus]